ncbi:predicted protein [Naegleria gruberi]|uniref:Predicted protein n=1 Tax=Naegleria gruberi TaxID=5762 RepID=D2VUP7_NAEGR|nr:uncharacterized protein NAEGRDRAFT_72739 [Naegleria gruberi]EFC39491.1 predicted protein [Naegleria gruberi]|eukprot:XP_002672235.1 predicted protein [Naegleria gruberi strain NEG-M]
MNKKLFGLIIVAALTLFLLTTFAVWMGLLLGEKLYEPIETSYTEYLNTTCLVNQMNLTSTSCCSKSCSQCRECDRSLYPSCYNTTFLDVVFLNQSSSPCCDSSKCCKNCCETCKNCWWTGKYQQCSSYECNCRCCSSVSSNLCTYECNPCWKIHITFSYSTTQNETFSQYEYFTCSSQTCVDEKTSNYAVNNTVVCYYSPINQYPSLYRSYSETTTTKDTYKFGIMYTFVALFIISLVGLIITIIVLLVNCLRNVRYSNPVFNAGQNELRSNESTQ